MYMCIYKCTSKVPLKNKLSKSALYYIRYCGVFPLCKEKKILRPLGVHVHVVIN